MILDTLALVAVLFREPEAPHFARLIHDADRCLISAGNFLEPRWCWSCKPRPTPTAPAIPFYAGLASSSSR